MPTITAFAYSFWHASNYFDNGDGEIRTLDPLLARQVLSQLSYAPIWVTYLIIQSHSASGLEKTRTSDLTLIRRAL